MILHVKLIFEKNIFSIKNEHHKIYNMLLFLQGRQSSFLGSTLNSISFGRQFRQIPANSWEDDIDSISVDQISSKFPWRRVFQHQDIQQEDVQRTPKYFLHRFIMGEDFRLKWNDHHNVFFSTAEQLCHGDHLTDVTLSCGDKEFSAHKLVQIIAPRAWVNVLPDHPYLGSNSIPRSICITESSLIMRS